MRNSNGTIYFLCGLGVGVAAATLFAARSGAETRAQIAATVGGGVDQVKAKAQELGKAVEDRVQAGRQSVQDRVREVSQAVEAGKQAYRESLGKSADFTA